MIEMNHSRRESATSSDRTTSNSVKIEAFVDWQRENNEVAANARVKKAEKAARTARPQLDSKRAPEDVRGVWRITTKKSKKKGESLVGDPEMS